ncbi:MAG: Uma2 family endonuclease [Chloroflexi bacterium]|nr:Uma2 family endonuclease [Chloroflexota bacterium]
MLVGTKLMTAEEFFEHAPQDKRSELVRGEMIEMAPASEEHGTIAGNIFAALHNFVRKNKLGKVYAAETGFILSHEPDTVRAPDAAFVAATRLGARVRRGGFFEGAPDLVVEVASPSESAEDIQDKVIDYLSAGTRMVLYLHPRSKTITVYRSLDNIRVLTLNDTLDGGDVLPGFRVTLEEIFVE